MTEVGNSLAIAITLSTCVEACTEYVKSAFPKIADCTWAILLITLALGIIGAFALDIDLLTIVGVPVKAHWVANIISGIVLSRGSNFVYDIIGKFRE